MKTAAGCWWPCLVGALGLLVMLSAAAAGNSIVPVAGNGNPIVMLPPGVIQHDQDRHTRVNIPGSARIESYSSVPGYPAYYPYGYYGPITPAPLTPGGHAAPRAPRFGGHQGRHRRYWGDRPSLDSPRDGQRAIQPAQRAIQPAQRAIGQ